MEILTMIEEASDELRATLAALEDYRVSSRLRGSVRHEIAQAAKRHAQGRCEPAREALRELKTKPPSAATQESIRALESALRALQTGCQDTYAKSRDVAQHGQQKALEHFRAKERRVNAAKQQKVQELLQQHAGAAKGRRMSMVS